MGRLFYCHEKAIVEISFQQLKHERIKNDHGNRKEACSDIF